MLSATQSRSLVNEVRQSPPVDTSAPYDPSWIGGKTILITGGASGFGEGFFRKWAAHGANVIIGDVDDARGRSLVEEVRKSTRNQNHHYLHCDVRDWQSQVDFFRNAAMLSPEGGIDAVVANAGVTDSAQFETPIGLDSETPPKPSLMCVEVGLIGVLYTAHLAMFYLPLNEKSQKADRSPKPVVSARDRHLLLIGSMASILPFPGQALYSVAKHGVLGLFRSLRATAFVKGIRVNLLCPYFIDTPFIKTAGRVLLAGGATGKAEDVIDAATRLMADMMIVGRSLVVGPKVNISIDDELQLVPQTDKSGRELAVWEVNAYDFDNVEIFAARFVKLVNTVEALRGWVGWASDLIKALSYPLRALLGKR